ncbi:large conductance mechanosensitive channel [Nakamurella panacisegetis]|uniref:Large-conductance mechanosensitive channel n=1 Tax=Nakamurella panacisegetis TaxID=1090615 RepID=A0A1H0IWE2_9ACTN|nr:large conductance mechanosensitive channel protein MscL [Nakamurella panacisegetis]SDO35381.1 large conductance mechanosensitive channel [Nakamurella panacisegetis]
MLKGFKDFIMRGNVVELAIAVVIGTAFTAVVSAFTKYIISPIIAAVGGTNVNGLAIRLVKGNDASLMDFGAVITAGITFLITAAVVYFVFVLPLNKLAERRKRGEIPAPATPTELELLIEIRDLLAAGNTDAAAAVIEKTI